MTYLSRFLLATCTKSRLFPLFPGCSSIETSRKENPDLAVKVGFRKTALRTLGAAPLGAAPLADVFPP